MKPAYSVLRCKGFGNVGYIDDTYLQGKTFYDCEVNISTAGKLFRDLDLTSNMGKSVPIPTQCITLLGFALTSVLMSVSPTSTKAMKIKSKAVELLNIQSPKIRTVSEVIGLMVAGFPGVMYGPRYCRQLELKKVAALKQSRGKFEATVNLSDKARSDLQ